MVWQKLARRFWKIAEIELTIPNLIAHCCFHMKPIHSLVLTLLVQLAVTGLSTAKEKSLFDGTTLDGWHNPYEWGEAWVEDGAIALRADKKFFLVADGQYSDFTLELEVMLPPEGKSNSGVMFRAHVTKNKVFGYQAECDPSERAWTGGLYDEGRRGWLFPEKEQRGEIELFQAPLGEWINYKIVARGDHLQIFINGRKITDYHDDTDASGYIAVQHHGEDGQIYRFRNIRITEH